MAPEMFSGQEYDKAVDLYAFGLALREILNGHSIATENSFDLQRSIYARGRIVEPYVVFPYLSWISLILHRDVLYTFLGVHVALFLVSYVCLDRYNPALRQACNLLTHPDAAERGTAKEHLANLKWCRRWELMMRPSILWVLVLFPFDVLGYQWARDLTTYSLLLYALSITYEAPQPVQRWIEEHRPPLLVYYAQSRKKLAGWWPVKDYVQLRKDGPIEGNETDRTATVIMWVMWLIFPMYVIVF
jgi:serine/threonine protein kinase